MKQSLSELKQRYANIAGVKLCAHDNGLNTVQLENNYGTINIYLQGAQLTSYSPVNGKEVIWLSESAYLLPNKPIRGGVPICWPWFGQHPVSNDLPQHGFARTSLFHLETINHNQQGDSDIVLKLESNEDTLQLWPYRFELYVCFNLGKNLTIRVITKNTGENQIPLTQAIHSYFKVENIFETQVSGFEQCHYFNKIANETSKQNEKMLVVTEETDRIYYQNNAQVELKDKNNTLMLQHQGSDSTVIWNPWQTNAKSISDFDDDGYKQMICIESAMTQQNYKLQPGESHQLIQIINAT